MRSTPICAVFSQQRAIFLVLILATAAPAITDAAAQNTTPLQHVVREALHGNPEIQAAGRERDARLGCLDLSLVIEATLEEFWPPRGA